MRQSSQQAPTRTAERMASPSFLGAARPDLTLKSSPIGKYVVERRMPLCSRDPSPSARLRFEVIEVFCNRQRDQGGLCRLTPAECASESGQMAPGPRRPESAGTTCRATGSRSAIPEGRSMKRTVAKKLWNYISGALIRAARPDLRIKVKPCNQLRKRKLKTCRRSRPRRQRYAYCAVPIHHLERANTSFRNGSSTDTSRRAKGPSPRNGTANPS
jgi:hypothetical protein